LERARRVGTEDSNGRAGVSFEVRAAVLTLWAAIGTKRTWRRHPAMSVFGGKRGWWCRRHKPPFRVLARLASIDFCIGATPI